MARVCPSPLKFIRIKEKRTQKQAVLGTASYPGALLCQVGDLDPKVSIVFFVWNHSGLVVTCWNMFPSSDPGLSHSLPTRTCSFQVWHQEWPRPKQRPAGPFTEAIQITVRGGAVGGMAALQRRKESDPLNQKMTLYLLLVVYVNVREPPPP